VNCYKVAAHLSQSRTRVDNLYDCEDSRLRTPKKWALSPTRTSKVPNLSPNRQASKSPVKRRSKSKGDWVDDSGRHVGLCVGRDVAPYRTNTSRFAPTSGSLPVGD
jgi:hypothetical protein